MCAGVTQPSPRIFLAVADHEAVLARQARGPPILRLPSASVHNSFACGSNSEYEEGGDSREGGVHAGKFENE